MCSPAPMFASAKRGVAVAITAINPPKTNDSRDFSAAFLHNYQLLHSYAATVHRGGVPILSFGAGFLSVTVETALGPRFTRQLAVSVPKLRRLVKCYKA